METQEDTNNTQLENNVTQLETTLSSEEHKNQILFQNNENLNLNNLIKEEQKQQFDKQTSTPGKYTYKTNFKIKLFEQNILDTVDDQQKQIDYHKISIAPMLNVTNSIFRVFFRFLTRYSMLYTEMINENAILLSQKGYEEFLDYFPIEHPVVVQLGGSDPEKLPKAAQICEKMGYDEVNLNVGCPSPKVSKGSFGACLMKESELVSKLMKNMNNAVSIPCTVKCRLGVDDFDSYEFVQKFVDQVSSQGDVKHFIIHARKAFLKGLDPEANRNVPPLKYDWVIQLKKDFPSIDFSINGGFKQFESVENILKEENKLKGCMIGRLAQNDPWQFSDIDRLFYNKPNPGYTRREILEQWADFGEFLQEEYNLKFKKRFNVSQLTKPIMNLFAGEQRNGMYRRFLGEHQNVKKYQNNFGDFIHTLIQEYSQFNKEGLDKEPNKNN